MKTTKTYSLCISSIKIAHVVICSSCGNLQISQNEECCSYCSNMHSMSVN